MVLSQNFAAGLAIASLLLGPPLRALRRAERERMTPSEPMTSAVETIPASDAAPVCARQQLLIVVAREAVADFCYFAHAFEDVHWAKVVLDRRRAERRRSGPRLADDRRRTDRRTRPAIDEQLRKAAWVVVR
jgi:hypothetical protein